MADYPALPLWTDAYLGDTMHLSLEEHGAYLKLLMIAWRSSGCCLPDDDARLATMLGVSRRRWSEKLRPAIAPFWMIENGNWRQKRLEKERRFVRDRSEKQRRNAGARWDAKALEKNSSGSATASPAADAPTPTPTSIDSPSLRSGGAEAPLKPLEAVVFERGKAVLGNNSGGLITKLRKIVRDDEEALRLIELASQKQDPVEYVSRIIRNKHRGDRPRIDANALREQLLKVC